MRRVVVTGLGTINPIGNNVKSSWSSLLNSKSGISNISKFDVVGYPCTVAGHIDDNLIENVPKEIGRPSDLLCRR